MSDPRPESSRYLLVYLPAFRLERCGYAADELVGLVDEVQNATRLVALTPGARAAGLRPAMTAAEARALIPEVILEPHRADEEEVDRVALASAFGAFSDRITFPFPDAVVAEITHTAAIFGGEEATVERAEALASSLGHLARAVVADDPLAALALAVCDRQGVVAPGQTAEALAPLPMAALAVGGEVSAPPALLTALRAIGIDTIGPFAALDPASVAGRYGPHGVRLHQVARGLPASVPALDWSPLRGTPPTVRTPVAGATTTLQLHALLPELLGQLATRLDSRDLAAVQLRVILRLELRGGVATSHTLRVAMGRPTRNPAVLERLIRTRLERVRIEAPIEELWIEVAEAVAEQGWQPGLTDRAEATEPLPDLLARLRDHLGDAAVHTATLVDAWRPEATWAPQPVTQALPPSAPSPLPLEGDPPPGAWSDDPVEVQSAWERSLRLPRPTLLSRTPVRIEVESRAGPLPRPLRIRLPDQPMLRISRAEGPERLQGEWWSPQTRFDRTYWAVEVSERVAWIFEEHGHWYLQGWFD